MQEEIRDILKQLWEVIDAHPQSLKLRRATLQLEGLLTELNKKDELTDDGWAGS